jgi:hypothetical protein
MAGDEMDAAGLPEGFPPALPRTTMEYISKEVNEYDDSLAPEVQDRPEILKDEIFYVDVELPKKEAADEQEWWSVPGIAISNYLDGKVSIKLIPSKRLSEFDVPAVVEVGPDTVIRTWVTPGGAVDNRKIADSYDKGISVILDACSDQLQKSNAGYRKAVVLNQKPTKRWDYIKVAGTHICQALSPKQWRIRRPSTPNKPTDDEKNYFKTNFFDPAKGEVEMGDISHGQLATNIHYLTLLMDMAASEDGPGGHPQQTQTTRGKTITPGWKRS